MNREKNLMRFEIGDLVENSFLNKYIGIVIGFEDTKFSSDIFCDQNIKVWWFKYDRMILTDKDDLRKL